MKILPNRPQRKGEEKQNTRLEAVLLFLLVACGGPKKFIFSVSGNVNKPAEIPESEYARIYPVISKVPVKGTAEVRDKKGRLVERKGVKTNISDGKISMRFDFMVDDLSYDLKINVNSEKFITFSSEVLSDKFERIRRSTHCREGDIDEDGYDYICFFNFSIVPNVSDEIRKYIEFRERLISADEKNFCSVYVTVSQDINNLHPDLREFAISDAMDIYNSFVDRVIAKANEIFMKAKNRNCTEKEYLERIKGYFCLPDRFISDIRATINLCNALALYDEGLAFLRRGQIARALERFREATRTKPDFPDPYIAMGDIYFDEKRYDDARDSYRRALEYVQNVTLYEKLGDAYFKIGVFEAAEESYRKAIDAAVESPPHTILHKRAVSLRMLERWEQAIEPARKAADMLRSSPEIKYDRELQRKLSQYLTLLGEIYLNLNRKEEGKRALEEALELNPYEDRALLLLAQLHSSSENRAELKKAKEYYEKLFLIDSALARSGEIWYKYALLLEQLQEDETQLTSALERTVRLSPNNDQAYLKLARIYERRKGYEKVAEEMYRKAYENSDEKSRSENLKNYIQFLFKQGSYAVAKRTVSDHISKYPQDRQARKLYNESNLMLYAINPQSLKKMGLPQNVIDEIYVVFSSIPDSVASEIVETIGMDMDFFLRLDPYKRMVLVVAYMDILYGTTGKGPELQKAGKYRELFGKNMSQNTANALSKLNLQKIGIDLK